MPAHDARVHDINQRFDIISKNLFLIRIRTITARETWYIKEQSSTYLFSRGKKKTDGNLNIWQGSLGFATEIKLEVEFDEPLVLSDGWMTLTESSSISPWISGLNRAAILIFCKVVMWLTSKGRCQQRWTLFKFGFKRSRIDCASITWSYQLRWFNSQMINCTHDNFKLRP